MTDHTHPIDHVEGDRIIPEIATPRRPANVRKLVAVALLLVLLFSVIGVLAFMLVHHWREANQAQTQAKTDTSLVAQSHTLSMPPATGAAASPTSAQPAASGASQAQASVPPGAAAAGTRVPSLAEADDGGQAIDVRPDGSRRAHSGPTGGTSAPHRVDPDDAPIFPGDTAPDVHGRNVAVGAGGAASLGNSATGGQAGAVPPSSTGDSIADARASLASYRTQLAGMVDSLQKRVAMATGQGGAGAGTGGTGSASSYMPMQFAPGQGGAQGGQGVGASGSPALFGTLDKSSTPRVRAQMLGDRSLIIPKETLILCGLTTRVISATSGFVGCQTERDVYSENGRVVLLERGSHLDGEYRIVQVRPGVTRIPVLWTRIRTPLGVTVDLDSPATGGLGESGLEATVDNRWGERLGAAVMLSLIQDAVQYETAKQTSQSGSSTQVVLPNTSVEGQRMAEEVLSATINIPPLLSQNQGAIAGVYVARDLDFSSVYALRPQ